MQLEVNGILQNCLEFSQSNKYLLSVYCVLALGFERSPTS